jgi:hypothetical protein
MAGKPVRSVLRERTRAHARVLPELLVWFGYCRERLTREPPTSSTPAASATRPITIGRLESLPVAGSVPAGAVVGAVVGAAVVGAAVVAGAVVGVVVGATVVVPPATVVVVA